RPVAADPVVGVVAVEAGLGNPPFVEGLDAPGRAFPQLVERPELDRLGGAGGGAGGLQARAEAVVAHRALEGAPATLLAAALALVDHAVRAGRDAVAAAVAHVV